MSYQAMTLAAAVPLKAPKKALLFTIANYTNQDGAFWPSYNTLADEAGLSRRTAINYINEFVQDGLISRTHRIRENKSATSNFYSFTVSQWLKKNGYQISLSENGGLIITKPSAQAALPLVNELHQGSEPNALPVVNELHQGSEPNAPLETVIDTVKETVIEPIKEKSIFLEGKYFSVRNDRVVLLPEFPQKTKAKKDRSQQVLLPDWVDLTVMSEFIRYREGMGKHMTGRALSRLINELSNFQGRGYLHTQALNDAMDKGWQSVFLPEHLKQSSQSRQPQNSAYDDENTDWALQVGGAL